jgi:hypothetical protein
MLRVLVAVDTMMMVVSGMADLETADLAKMN